MLSLAFYAAPKYLMCPPPLRPGTCCPTTTAAATQTHRQLITLRVACVCTHAGDSPPGSSGVGGAEGCGNVSGKGPKRFARRHALPPMVAVLKLWGANEATVALLVEGAELRLHRWGATREIFSSFALSSSFPSAICGGWASLLSLEVLA